MGKEAKVSEKWTIEDMEDYRNKLRAAFKVLYHKDYKEVKDSDHQQHKDFKKDIFEKTGVVLPVDTVYEVIYGLTGDRQRAIKHTLEDFLKKVKVDNFIINEESRKNRKTIATYKVYWRGSNNAKGKVSKFKVGESGRELNYKIDELIVYEDGTSEYQRRDEDYNHIKYIGMRYEHDDEHIDFYELTIDDFKKPQSKYRVYIIVRKASILDKDQHYLLGVLCSIGDTDELPFASTVMLVDENCKSPNLVFINNYLNDFDGALKTWSGKKTTDELDNVKNKDKRWVENVSAESGVWRVYTRRKPRLGKPNEKYVFEGQLTINDVFDIKYVGRRTYEFGSISFGNQRVTIKLKCEDEAEMFFILYAEDGEVSLKGEYMFGNFLTTGSDLPVCGFTVMLKECRIKDLPIFIEQPDKTYLISDVRFKYLQDNMPELWDKLISTDNIYSI